MADFKMFGIPNCNTVKKAQDFLKKKKVAFEFIDFKKQKPTVEMIKKWELAFGDLPVNRAGLTYKKLKNEFESLSPAKKYQFICDNASMIKRPILEKSGKVLHFGFSEEAYTEI